MENATLAGSSNARTRSTLARYEEWHNQARDQADEGSVYTLLARTESTVRASVIDLGITL